MIDFLKDLVLHFSIILSLGFMYNYLAMQKRNLYQKQIFKLAVLSILVLTMVFPVQFEGGLKFDLKLIPVFIAFFYIGRIDSILLIGFMLLLQSMLDFGHLAVMVLNYSIILVLFFAIRYMYNNATLNKKIALALFVYSLITSTRLTVLIKTGDVRGASYLAVFSIISFLALAITIYIIEMTNFQLKTMHELYKAEKFSAISQLAASVAHEIRNPMTTIRGFMQVLQGDKNLSDDQYMFISISLQELDRAQTIINNFLSLAKPNTGGTTEIDLTSLLKDIIEFMRSYSHLSNTELVEEIEEDLTIKGDPHEIRQVFINVIKNGIEAMPYGGNFYISAVKDKNYVTIKFKDQGMGMDSEQLERLGTPYYSTKEKGTGLGLMISYDIIYRMKGEILVESEKGSGTTFTIVLPAD